jgi:choline dehydrogenase-like flavoprotein
MGTPDDVTAVVDTRARVYNTKGLRVCDASIFPVKPNGNTQAPVYGIAQRVFELVSAEEYDKLLK